MASLFRSCADCGHEFSDEATCCPHCGRPGLYVNVSRAESTSERAALDRRYDAAISEAQSRNCDAVVRDFEQAAAKSKAALAQSGHVVQRLFSSDAEIYGTYFQEIRAGLRLPKGENWDLLRTVADATLFGSGGAQIRFAALTLDEEGWFNYGDHVLFFREDMIAHRASVFEDNSALFVDRHRKTATSPVLPEGNRALWQERARLCVAKLTPEISTSTKPNEYAKILLTAGKTTATDKFVEVHICGPVTIRTVERLAIQKRTLLMGRRAARKKLQKDLTRYGVLLEEI